MVSTHCGLTFEEINNNSRSYSSSFIRLVYSGLVLAGAGFFFFSFFFLSALFPALCLGWLVQVGVLDEMNLCGLSRGMSDVGRFFEISGTSRVLYRVQYMKTELQIVMRDARCDYRFDEICD